MKLRLLIAVFAMGALLPWALPGLGQFLQADVTNPYSTSRSIAVEESLVQFHLTVNDITNAFLEDLTSSEELNVNYPGSPEECSEDNRSTFCLGVALDHELQLLELALLEERDKVDYSDVDGRLSNLEDALQNNPNKQIRLEDELRVARETVELTLAVYNEAQLIYPLHVELSSMTEHLQSTRDQLASLRDTVELYPSRFNDVTTLMCK